MMKVCGGRTEIGEALSALLGIVPPVQTAKPILLNFFLQAEKERLFVEAMDLDIGSRICVEHVEVMEEGALALPANRLASLVREVPDRTITIEAFEDGHGATLQAAGYELKVLGEDPVEFPRVAEFSAEGVCEIDRDSFVENLRRVAVASSHDTARYQLTGVFLEIDGSRLSLTATDGKRLTNDQVAVKNPAEVSGAGIVPNRAVDTILKVVAQGEPQFKLGLGESELRVSFGSGDLSTKLVQGKYPDYRWVFSQQVRAKVAFKRSEMMAAVKAASLMTDKETATIFFLFEDDSCRLTTQAANIGESRIQVPIEMEGDSVGVYFNPNYFIDAMRCFPEEEIRIELGDSDKPCTFRGRQQYRHLIMPLVNEKGAGQ